MAQVRGNASNLMTMRVIWLAILSSIFIYGVMAVIVPTEIRPAGGESMRTVLLALHVAGVAVLVAAWIVPGMLMRRSPEEAMREAIAAPAAGAPPRVAPKIVTAHIVRWAMVEAAAIFGLIAAFMSGDARLFFPLGVLALMGMFLSFPSRSLAEPA